jgi:hypothetical protein
MAEAIIAEPDDNKRVSHVAASVMGRVKPLAKRGEIGRGRNRDGVTNSIPKGTNADYLAARIKRDRPDIAVRVERGEADPDGTSAPEPA